MHGSQTRSQRRRGVHAGCTFPAAITVLIAFITAFACVVTLQFVERPLAIHHHARYQIYVRIRNAFTTPKHAFLLRVIRCQSLVSSCIVNSSEGGVFYQHS